MRAVVATGPAKQGDLSKVHFVSNHPVPRPRSDQVLIKVAASSVNPVDWKILEDPIIGFPHVLGFDVAGTVVQVGNRCTRLKVGDEVWADLGKDVLLFVGLQLGAWAEYAVADESQVGLKPKKLDFQDAAALPLAALTDIQALRKTGAPWTGRNNFTVVITSGAGGTGIPAIQLARAMGASHVVTSSSPEHADLLKSFGATTVVDYHKTSIWEALPEDSVDVVYDNYGAPGTADLAMKVIRPGGVFIFLPGKGGHVSTRPKQGVKQINYGLCDSSKHEDLNALAAYAEAGKLKGYVSQTFGLEDFAKAFNVSIDGHTLGKVGIKVAEPSPQQQAVLV